VTSPSVLIRVRKRKRRRDGQDAETEEHANWNRHPRRDVTAFCCFEDTEASSSTGRAGSRLRRRVCFGDRHCRQKSFSMQPRLDRARLLSTLLLLGEQIGDTTVLSDNDQRLLRAHNPLDNLSRCQILFDASISGHQHQPFCTNRAAGQESSTQSQSQEVTPCRIQDHSETCRPDFTPSRPLTITGQVGARAIFRSCRQSLNNSTCIYSRCATDGIDRMCPRGPGSAEGREGGLDVPSQVSRSTYGFDRSAETGLPDLQERKLQDRPSGRNGTRRGQGR